MVRRSAEADKLFPVAEEQEFIKEFTGYKLTFLFEKAAHYVV